MTHEHPTVEQDYSDSQRAFLEQAERRGVDTRLFGKHIPEVHFNSLTDFSIGGDRPPIAYIHTGGTLMMVPSSTHTGVLTFDGALNIGKTLEACDYVAGVHSRYRILAIKLDTIDSKEVKPDLWKAIAATIKTIYDQIEGVVIGHGTNTLEYSAAATAFALRNPSIPIVFTASQLPILGYPGSDGMGNLTGAMEVAANADLAEVVGYAHGELFRGSRFTKRNDTRLNTLLEARVTGPLGYFTGSTLPGQSVELRAGARSRSGKRKHELVFAPEFSTHVSILKQNPGMAKESLSSIVDSKETIGILLETYGPGAVPAEMVPIIQKHTENGYPIFVSSTCAESGVSSSMVGHDEDAIRAHKAGLRTVGDMSTTAATVKLMHVIGNLPSIAESASPAEKKEYLEQVRTEMLRKNYAGEISNITQREDY